MIRVKRNTYLEGRIKVFPDPNDVLIRGKEEKERFGNDKRRETSSERGQNTYPVHCRSLGGM